MSKELYEYVKSQNIFQENETVVIALSGGVDSMVLFDILSRLNLELVIAHVNHNVREESKHEFKKIKELAKQHNLPFEGYIIVEEIEGNFQDDARNIRYDFFKGVAQKYNAKKVVLAHHLDDQIETILMRIARGSSFTGYGGIKQIRTSRNLTIYRPLLSVTKDEILDYAKVHNITYYEDESNKKDVYTRNRFRNNIIPLLKLENHNLGNQIQQFSEYLNEADEYITKATLLFYKEHSMYNTIDLNAFKDLDSIIQKKVIIHAVNLASNNSVEVKYKQLQQIIEMCNNPHPNQYIVLSNNYHFVKSYDALYVEKAKELEEVNITVTSPKEYFVSDNCSYIFSDKIKDIPYTNFFELCYNEKVYPLYLRRRVDGDKMKLNVGTKKVKDILIDQKIPTQQRDELILLADDEYVLWIPEIKKGYSEGQKKLYIYEVK